MYESKEGEETVIQEKERVNYVFLLTVAVYLTLSLAISMLGDVPFPVMILLSQFSLVLVPAVFLFKRRDFLRSIPHERLSFGTVVLVVLLTLCMEPVLSLINALSLFFTNAPTTERIVEAGGQYGFPAMFLMVAVIPAVLEETVYRAVFFKTYSDGGVFAGAILSGLMFALMHGNLNQFLYTVVMGIVFALTVYATKSIFASMIMHLTINGLSTVLLYLTPKLLEKAEELLEQTGEGNVEELLSASETASEAVRALLFPAMLGLVLSFVIFRTISEKCGTEKLFRTALKRKDGFKRFRQMFTLPLLVGMILMALLMVEALFV